MLPILMRAHTVIIHEVGLRNGYLGIGENIIGLMDRLNVCMKYIRRVKI
jgi:hypothetical protein